MRVIHFHINGDKAALDYATALSAGMEGEAESELCHSIGALRKSLDKWCPDIVHIHGCWHASLAMAQSLAERHGARVVITPHGQMEPWILKQKYWSDKLPRLMAYQRRCLRRAYAIVAMGRMEAANLQRHCHGGRVETVLNSLITDTISQRDMAMQVMSVYQKVLNTDVAELMDDDTIMALRGIVKAGLTGDARWLNDDERQACANISGDKRHKLLVLSCQEGINTVVAQGVATLGLPNFSQLYADVESYNTDKAKPINPPAPTEAAIATYIKDTLRLTRSRRLTLAHIVALAATLRRCDINEDKLNAMLADKRMARHASRMMHALSIYTGLEEGFMPMEPRHDRGTDKLMTTITKHLKT